MYCRILESGPNCFRSLRVASGLIRLSFRPAINVKWKVSGMANKSMRIAIAGGGPSGLTLASILGREASNKEAFDITIFERGAADRDQGSGWDVDEAGQAALIRAGVELKSIQRPDSDRQRSYRVDDMDQPIAAFGLPSSINKLGSIKEQLGLLASPSLETERKKMVDGLTNALSSNTKIFYEAYISGLEQNDDGSTLDGRFDVVIDASGSSSSLRSTRFTPEVEARYTGTSYVQGQIDLPEQTLDPGIIDRIGEGTLNLYGPTQDGKGTQSLNFQRFGADPSNQVTTAWIEIHTHSASQLKEELGFEGIYEMTRDPAAVQRAKDFVKQQLSGFPEQHQTLFDSIDGARVLTFTIHPSCEEALEHTTPDSEGLPFLSIGDALHALPPWSGMSGNYALRDAADLATSLIQQQRKDWTPTSVAASLRGLEEDFMRRTDKKRMTVDRSPELGDYMDSTDFKDFVLAGKLLGKPPRDEWKIEDEIDVAVMAETVRFFLILNSLDNYGVPTANELTSVNRQFHTSTEESVKLAT